MKINALVKYGVASKDYSNKDHAKGDTYTQINGKFPSTNIACPENPYKDEILNAKYVLDVGCGVGRNLPWIMNNSNATYIGIDPNTSMTQYFWDVQLSENPSAEKWKERTYIYSDISHIPSEIKFDYVITTFVFQHLGYRFNITPNLDDITQRVIAKMKNGSVWFLIEHDSEENWIQRWIDANKIKLDVYIRGYKGLPELTDRDHLATNGGHHLMIFKYNENLLQNKQ